MYRNNRNQILSFVHMRRIMAFRSSGSRHVFLLLRRIDRPFREFFRGDDGCTND